MDNLIEVIINNNYGLKYEDRYSPVIYNGKPIGFINIITNSKITISLWTEYIDFVPVFNILDKYLESKGHNTDCKKVSGFEMIIKEK